jgi:oligopeptide transport system substrate-binding protein
MIRIVRVCCLIVLLLSSLAGAACSQGGSTAAGGTLTLYGEAPSSLDPALARDATSLEYIVEIFSGLVAFDPDLNLKPEIAQSWDLSADGKTYTFHLRDGVVFHDGRAVTADDFKYSLERACDPSTGSMTAESFLGDIVGVKERLSGAALEISGVKVIDDLTLQITIDSPKEYFLSKLAYPVAYVVDRNNVESGTDWWTHPNGTGPFRLESWQQDDSITLRRNDSYYLQPAKLDRVVYLLWSGIPMRMYEDGQIDVTSVGLGDIERVLDVTNPLHSELHVTPEFSLAYIGFNVTEPPFDDPKVRQAFCHAIDKDKIVRLVFKNLVASAAGVLPPGMPGYSEDIQGLEFNVDLAKSLLAESRYGGADGLPPIVLTAPGRGTASPLDAALADMWRRNLGVEIEIRQLEPEKYADLLMQQKDEMFELGWGADYPDPQSFLEMLFHTGAADNFGEYSNPEADALLDSAAVERESETRMQLYGEAEQLIVSDAACLPLYFPVSYTLVKPYVENLPLTPFWIPRLRYASIQPH